MEYLHYPVMCAPVCVCLYMQAHVHMSVYSHVCACVLPTLTFHTGSQFQNYPGIYIASREFRGVFSR